ncbi:Uncharacterised protein [Acetobacterium wieringae]|uniref:AP2 domain-containing protein n=1 Tax=Acetobacterium wieringae TaxID=52694 RepID=UPI001DB2E288|nr:AP2 domain-containing protein [Acetobacterium wieringae]VUZ28498.1 Uncharacterised protein [Acetobacterium wieringae]
MSAFIDLTGQKFGKLVVTKRVGTKRGGALWLCKCECGKTVEVITGALKSGNTRSCGCLHAEYRVKTESLAEHNKRLLEVRKIDEFQGTKINLLTSKLAINNTSGTKGVTWDRNKNKWVAQIVFKNKHIFLGRFNNINDAVTARKAAEEKYFKPVIEKYASEQ